MPSRFDNLTTAKLRAKLPGTKVQRELKANRAYVDGDHWQGGAAWAGPIPTGKDAPRLLAEIMRGFVAQNKIAEVLGRQEAGVVGREPRWGLTVRRPLAEDEAPTQDEQTRIDEAEAWLTEWWDQHGIHLVLRQLVRTALWARTACLRFFVPPASLEANEDGELLFTAEDMSAALGGIWLDVPDPMQATVWQDPRSMQQIGIYSYELEPEDADGAPRRRLDLTYLDQPQVGDQQGTTPGRLTVLEVAWGDGADGRSGPVAPLRLPLGGHLLMAQLELPLLVTEPVKSQQRLLNLALTMMQRNVVMGGFLERVILDGQVPGRYQQDEADPTKMVFVPEPLQTGPGTTNFIQSAYATDEGGKVITDGQGRPISTPVRYIRNEPVSVETFERTAEAAKTAILEECRQLHTKISGDAAASGESRRQAMADFVTDLLTAAGRVNVIGRQLIETALAFASYLANQPGRYDDLRATFVCRIDPGPIPADELRLVLERVAAELLSSESGMELTGVDDVDAEKAKIEGERTAKDARVLANAQRLAATRPPAPEPDPNQPPQGGA